MFLIVLYSAAFVFGLINAVISSFRTRLIQLLILASITPLFLASFHGMDLPSWFGIFLYGLLGCILLWELSDVILRLKPRLRREDFFRQLRKERGPYIELLKACYIIAKVRKGALIVIENKDSVEEWIRKGVHLDAEVNAQLVASIFLSPSSLHDGAMVVRGGRIVAASVVVPLTESLAVPHELGTRHRAALGLSERVDAINIVVSEETSVVSVAQGGKLYYSLALEKVPEIVERLARGKKVSLRHTGKTNSSKESSTLVVSTA